MPEFVVLNTSFLLKLLIFNLAYLVFLTAPELTTDLFVSTINGLQFFHAVCVVNAMIFLMYKGFVTSHGVTGSVRSIDSKINQFIIMTVIVALTLIYFLLGQKTLSLSTSMALLAIAANSQGVALLALAIFILGVPEAIALDEYIPIIFCALINVYVFLPWLKAKGRRFFYMLIVLGLALLIALATYYIVYRYSPFKLIERIFEQAAPLSWEGSPWLWVQPKAILSGMPEERITLVMNGTWDAQFKVTYFIRNSPVIGSIFLLLCAYLLGAFAARTLKSCRSKKSNVATNFLKLKLLLILLEVLGEKVSDVERILAYVALILLIELLYASAVPRRLRLRRPAGTSLN